MAEVRGRWNFPYMLLTRLRQRLSNDLIRSDHVQRDYCSGVGRVRFNPKGSAMPRIHHLLAALLAVISLGTATGAAHAEQRIALVVGNAAYQAGALATPANDAGLIAQTLQAAGFDVVGARDLDQDSLRRALRDFLDKATAAGPDTVAFIYVSGY